MNRLHLYKLDPKNFHKCLDTVERFLPSLRPEASSLVTVDDFRRAYLDAILQNLPTIPVAFVQARMPSAESPHHKVPALPCYLIPSSQQPHSI